MRRGSFVGLVLVALLAAGAFLVTSMGWSQPPPPPTPQVPVVGPDTVVALPAEPDPRVPTDPSVPPQPPHALAPPVRPVADDPAGPAASPTPTSSPLVAPTEPAEPPVPGPPVESTLTLTAPPLTDPGATETFVATWVDEGGYGLDGVLALQRADGAVWTDVTALDARVGRARAAVRVEASGVYRLRYRGGPDVAAQVSSEVAVIAERRLTSQLSLAVPEAVVFAGDAVEVEVTWRNADGVPIVGEVEVQAQVAGTWEQAVPVTTVPAGTVAVAVRPEVGTTAFRVGYPGGTRYEPATSAEGAVSVVPARSIPVRTCSSQAEIDALPAGVGCRYTPVGAGTFVVGHDYNGNAWWNDLPLGGYVRLTGEAAGRYEVVDRVIGTGRAAALGDASRWACDDACDVILQTCTGPNTGFTWLRRLP